MNKKLGLVLAALLISSIAVYAGLATFGTAEAKTSRCIAQKDGKCIIQAENINKMLVDEAEIQFDLSSGGNGGGGTVDQNARDQIVALKNQVDVLNQTVQAQNQTIVSQAGDIQGLTEQNSQHADVINQLIENVSQLQQQAITHINVTNGTIVTPPPPNGGGGNETGGGGGNETGGGTGGNETGGGGTGGNETGGGTGNETGGGFPPTNETGNVTGIAFNLGTIFGLS